MNRKEEGTVSLMASSQDEIDLLLLGRDVLRRWRLISVISAVFVLLALMYLRTANFTYTVQLGVTPAQNSAGEGLAGQLGGLSSLASVVGVDLGGARGTSPFQLYIASLKSRQVAADLSQSPELMSAIFADEWDKTAGQWKQPQSRLTPLKNAIKAILGIPAYPWQPPDAARLQEYVEAAVDIEQNPKTPVVTIRIDHRDPQFAIEFLAALHHAADERLRKNALDRTGQYIDYLSAKLETVQVAEHRSALAEALSEQEKTRMMTSAAAPFAAEPFGAPTASARPTRPKPFRVFLGSVLAGGFIGVIAAMLLSIRSARRR